MSTIEPGWSVAMDWADAMFLHWPVSAASLRPRIPAGVEIDTFEGTAWVSIVAFRIARARRRGVPAALAWRSFPEINVRTYVTAGGRAGVWFFSLDADSRIAVELGRRAVRLPYYRASIVTAFESGRMSYALRRADRRAAAARFVAQASFGDPVRTPAPGTLEHWLVERYCFFTTGRARTLRGDVAHDSWPIRDATAHVEENSLLDAAGIVPLSPAPLAHVSSGVTTRAWALQDAF